MSQCQLPSWAASWASRRRCSLAAASASASRISVMSSATTTAPTTVPSPLRIGVADTAATNVPPPGRRTVRSPRQVSPGQDRVEVEGGRAAPGSTAAARARRARPARRRPGVGLGGRLVDEGDHAVGVGGHDREPQGVQQAQLVDVALHLDTSASIRWRPRASAHCLHETCPVRKVRSAHRP